MTNDQQAHTPTASWKSDVWIKRVIALVVFFAAAILLFARLGHYSLWDDEALTALTALGVWRTGDTTAVLGQTYYYWVRAKNAVSVGLQSNSVAGNLA